MKMARLMGIVTILLDEGRVSASQLAGRFEVSVRTIYRDMEQLAMAGIPVRAIAGPEGGFEVMPGFKLDKTVFTATELASLYMGLTSVAGALGANATQSVIAKLRHISPPGAAIDIEQAARQVKVEWSSWVGNDAVPATFKAVQAAMAKGAAVRFGYVGQHGKRSTRTVEPCQLLMKSGAWYLYGFCQAKDDYRTFRLSRMHGVELLGDRCEKRDFPDPQTKIPEEIVRTRRTIQLRIGEQVMDRVLEHCPIDAFTDNGDGTYDVDFPFYDNDYHYDVVLGFGPSCKCLGPKDVRDGLRVRLESMTQAYS